MSIKNILMVSIILSAFIVGVMLYPYIIYWIHTKEGDVTINAFIVLMIVIAIMGLCAANANVVYERWKEKEMFDEDADKVEARKSEIKELAKTGKIEGNKFSGKSDYIIDTRV